MSNYRNYVTNLFPVAPGATPTLKLGTGKNAPTLDRLQFSLAGTGVTAATIKGIRAFANGGEIYRDDDGTMHNARGSYMGLAPNANELYLDFTEPNARSAIEQNLSCIPLSLLSDFRVELDIDPAANANVSIKCVSHIRPPTNNPFIKKQRRITQGFVSGGEQSIYLPCANQGGKLVRAWIHEGVANNITAVELRAKSTIGLEGTRAQIQNDQIRNGLVPQAGVLCLDFIADGNLASWFDTSLYSEVTLKLFGTAADTYKVFLEYLDPIAGNI